MDEKELQEYLHNMGQKERRELTARLRLVKPKRKKAYKQIFRISSACSLRQN
jgi:predicted GNAT family N-acyltransferase